MSASAEYTDYVLEHLHPLGRVTTRPFFGGVGICHGGVQFAMIMRNTLYFVVDERSRSRYEAAGMQPFWYATKRRRVQVRRYFELPEDVLTDAETLSGWMREAVAVATEDARSKAPVRAKARRRR